MDSSKIKTLLVLGLAFCFALYLGVAAATAKLEALVWIGGGLFLTVCLMLGRHIWILIPATLGMKGSLNFIPGTPAPWQLMTAVVGGFFLLRWLTRVQGIHFKWSGVDIAIFLVGLTIFQALLRNPVGFSLFGGDVAGGKPYIIFALAAVAYFLISTTETDMKTWRWAVIAYIGVSFIDACVSALSGLSPAFAGMVIRYYSNVSFEAVADGSYTGDVIETRITQLAGVGSILGLMACTLWRPLAALDLRKPWRLPIALAALGFTIFGGFRGGAVRLYVNFLMGSILRRKYLDALGISIAAGLVLLLVIAALPVRDLPYSVQRLLTMVPGVEVDSSIAHDTKRSSELRFDMWKLVLTTDRYIDNKLLGDGFQYSASEMAAREALRLGDLRLAGGMTTEEMFITTGSYHGFHAETIRFTGAIGLIAATAALIAFAIMALRCIRAFEGHPYWGYVLFICMPFVIHPLWYWLVFGAYRNDFPVLIALAGMLRILDKLRLRETLGVTMLNSGTEIARPLVHNRPMQTTV